MREILFRAWDKKSKKMREIDSIAFNKDMDMFGCESVKLVNLWGYDIIEQKDIIVQREGKSFVLMEYTGLKDKNGVKIFEGDIVVCNRYEEKVDYLVLLKDLRDLPSELYGSSLNYRKVIGNIYENPELLGVE